SRLSHEHAAGLDLASDPDLAEALASAASRVKPALSLPVSLFSHPEDPRRRDGVLVAVPVFVAGEGARALHEPRAVRGFIVGMFSLTVMLDQTIALFRDEPDAPQLHVTLKLKPGPPATPDAPSVPFAESGSPAIGGGSPSSTRQLFDRLWEIEVQPVTPTALTVDELLARPSTLLTASVCIMMLLFLWIAWTLSRRHRVIQQRVGEQTAELRQKNVVLEGKERELHEANRRLLEMSNTDPLTGILNRRAFEVQSDKERERALRTGVPCGLLIFDVDQFKDYNDRYGHAAGDEVLRRVAGIINAEARRIDTVARYGGEEFVVLAAGTDAVGLLALGERIRGRIQDAAIQHAAAPKGVITVSGGGSLSSAALGHDPKLAFEVADRCLYQAKSTGRNRVVMVM
ncbi:MAG TPA: diguanylate cyclase, partial [Planctomycetota bacterium]|nr:diguanylate cyclase [Planctomycetota bacterium]